MNINYLESLKNKIVKLEEKSKDDRYNQAIDDVLDIIDEDIIFIQERIINGD